MSRLTSVMDRLSSLGRQVAQALKGFATFTNVKAAQANKWGRFTALIAGLGPQCYRHKAVPIKGDAETNGWHKGLPPADALAESVKFALTATRGWIYQGFQWMQGTLFLKFRTMSLPVAIMLKKIERTPQAAPA